MGGFATYSARLCSIVGLFVVSLLFLLFQGGKFAFMLFSIVAALTLYILLGRWSGISKARGVRTLPDIESGGSIEAGTSVNVNMQVRIPGFWPVPYVMIQERLVRQGGENVAIDTLLVPDWKRHAEVSYATPPLRRGVYRFEDTECATEDIFGLFRHQGRLQLPYAFKVLPQRVSIRDWKQLNQMLRGHPLRTGRAQFYRETTQVGGVREYVNGDRLSRIHWHATARTGAWKSKEFEREAIPMIVLILDRNKRAYKDEDQFELAVSITASILDFAATREMAVGFLSAGENTKVFEPKRGVKQKNAILNHLIETEPDGLNALSGILQERVRAFELGTFFVLVTPQFGEALMPSLTLLEQRRMKPCHMWVAAELATNVQEQWMRELQSERLPGYAVTSLDKLSLIVGGTRK